MQKAMRWSSRGIPSLIVGTHDFSFFAVAAEQDRLTQQQAMRDAAKAAAAAAVDSCAGCGMSWGEDSTKDSLWIACDSCNRWFHGACSGATQVCVLAFCQGFCHVLPVACVRLLQPRNAICGSPIVEPPGYGILKVHLEVQDSRMMLFSS